MRETNEHRSDIDDSIAQDCADDEAGAAALEKKLAEAEDHKSELISSGWRWRDLDGTQVLAHPDDPDANIWFHPYTGEQLYSPGLVELLKKNLQDSTR